MFIFAMFSKAQKARDDYKRKPAHGIASGSFPRYFARMSLSAFNFCVLSLIFRLTFHICLSPITWFVKKPHPLSLHPLNFLIFFQKHSIGVISWPITCLPAWCSLPGLAWCLLCFMVYISLHEIPYQIRVYTKTSLV